MDMDIILAGYVDMLAGRTNTCLEQDACVVGVTKDEVDSFASALVHLLSDGSTSKKSPSASSLRGKFDARCLWNSLRAVPACTCSKCCTLQQHPLVVSYVCMSLAQHWLAMVPFLGAYGARHTEHKTHINTHQHTCVSGPVVGVRR
jgi:hypothetical protein